MMNRIVYTSFLLGASFASTEAQVNTPPNIVLILCDDMGFSDLGCYGSEIQTPNIDRLAENGVRFSLFKNTGRSCPSRAALLTGHYQHEAGMGWMTAVDEHRPGYRGQITKNIPTIAEVMKANGYSTYMSGKWHVTVDGAFDAPNGSYPAQRGFDKYYGCLSGGGSYYKPTPVYSNLTRITEFPDDYYYTTAITDSAVSFVKQHPTDKPMFMYVAHYAPHLPLQAPADRVEKCRDRYKVGYDVLRKQRFDRLKELKFISDEMDYPVYQKEFGGKRPSWETLTPKQQEQWITDMATYAAMIEIVDSGIGELVETIKEKGILDNTVFIFLSDNGATKEGGYLGQLMADLSNTPYRSYKSQCFQGGTSTPFILSYGDAGKNKMKGQICRQPAHIIDILPTCMDIATATYPSEFKENLPGKSLLPSIHGKKIKPRELYFEHQSSCAIISDHWKLVRGSRNEPWELIDLSTDPFETKDLSAQYPRIAKKLEVKWNKWAEQCNVFPLENKPWTERINYYLKQNPDQSGKE
ncbi:MAG: arylsulfatase [Bacteroides thetaiotaomicron]|uniref:Arylsulfatase n=1 Tax=Bacteroides thetaiotaomicron TaxID=818 RepID=A0A943DP54_BACT4|nr:arylsulfatase [Bacteroides thetaiotaomicron]